ncbi:MAG: hypothetical protein CBE50_003490 [Flammeovirgaceae bacterium TMED290]|nr:MAG: hypothetical protein CBE50_003490 [Flammeovirgaceae bacterium TMED290]
MKIFFIISLMINMESFYNFKRGIKYYKIGDYKKAIKFFLEEKKNKKKFKNYFYLGHSYSFVNNNESAIEMYEKALLGKFKKSVIYFEMGMSYFLINKSEKALQNMNLAIKNDPKNISYLINRGSIKYDLGLIESACNDWAKAKILKNNSIDLELININCN